MGDSGCPQRRRNAQLGVYECYLILINLCCKYKKSARQKRENRCVADFFTPIFAGGGFGNQGRRSYFPSKESDARTGGPRRGPP